MKPILPTSMRGPLSATLDELTVWLAHEGYSRTMTPQLLGVARAFSAWMDDHEVSVNDLSTSTMDAFSTHYGPGIPGHAIVSQRLPALRRFLTETGLLPDPGRPRKRPRPPDGKHTAQPSTLVSQELDEWADWQRRTRNISEGCIRYRRMWVSELFNELATTTCGIDWCSCSPAVLDDFVVRRSNGYAPASRTAIVDSVRSLLRWALATGRIDRDLTRAVLQARTTRATLPRGLTTAEVHALLDSCDQNTIIGIRDAAVIRLLWRLGIRAGECARLRLDDINWQAGTLTVLGKGKRRLALPIPHDVGESLVSWMRVRPTVTDRAVFVRMRTPIQALTSAGISDIVKHRGETVGLDTVHAHRLRHSAAMNVIAHGGSLTEAQELLGHRNSAITSGLRPSRPRIPPRFGHTVRDGAAMSLFDELDNYLQQRRNLGYELKTTEYLLRSFCHWMAERGNTRTFTTGDALEWATSRPNTAGVWSTQRLTAVRPFAAWLNARGHDVPLIAKNLLPSPTTRRLPYIYSQTDGTDAGLGDI